MKADERRSHRLRTLSQVWNSSGKNDEAVLKRAMQMGVTKPTAEDYLRTIKARYK